MGTDYGGLLLGVACGVGEWLVGVASRFHNPTTRLKTHPAHAQKHRFTYSIASPIAIPMASATKFNDLKWDNGLLEVEGSAKAVLVEAERIFGKRHRDWQASAIERLVRKDDLFIKAGTGSGKSLVFQSMIAARPNGIVLVIVPLKSLMDDQVYPW